MSCSCFVKLVLWFMTVIHSFIYFFLVQWNVLRDHVEEIDQAVSENT